MNAKLKPLQVESPTELAPLDRAERVLGFIERKAQLADLARKSERIVEITGTPGYQEAQGARMALKNTRVEIQKLGKAAREDATAFSKAVIAKEKELIDVIEPEESRLQALQDVWDAAREAEKQAKVRAEQERLAAIRAKMDAIRDLPLQALGKSAPTIAGLIEHAQALDVSEFAGEQQQFAAQMKADAIESLLKLHADRVAADVEAAKLQADRAELERLRAEQAERQAEQDRQAAAARAEADRVARAAREQAAAEQRAQIAAEAAKQREAEALARAEREATEARERAQREAEAAKAKAAADAEAERLRAEAERLRVEAEMIEAEKARAARMKLERELAEVTMVSAATEARDLLVSEGRAHHPVTIKLNAALAREQEAV